MTTIAKTPPSTRAHGGAVGPPLWLPAVIYLALFAAGLIGTAVATGAHLPSPYDGTGTLRAFVADHATTLRIGGLISVACAMPLAIYTAVISARLRHLGVRAPGATIAQVGGYLAANCLLVSGFTQWALSRIDASADAGVLRALSALTFAAGGPGYVVSLGLLVAGVSIVALFTGLLPRWLAVAGIVLAVLAEVSVLSLGIVALSPLLPVGRFGGFAWLIAVGIWLPTSRAARRT